MYHPSKCRVITMYVQGSVVHLCGKGLLNTRTQLATTPSEHGDGGGIFIKTNEHLGVSSPREDVHKTAHKHTWTIAQTGDLAISKRILTVPPSCHLRGQRGDWVELHWPFPAG